MRNIVCLIRGHRCRVVQAFGPDQRRLKCGRCGGDWSMNDNARLIVPWCHELQSLYRDFGYEILEPIEFPAPVEPLTWREFCRATRWPIAFAVALGQIVSRILVYMETGLFGIVVSMAFCYAIVRFMARRAIDEAMERKRNDLVA
jgi:hypothetical protein